MSEGRGEIEYVLGISSDYSNLNNGTRSAFVCRRDSDYDHHRCLKTMIFKLCMCRLYNQWFQFADLDNDGVLSGTEAVGFFQRSGLPRNPTLFKVWQYVAGDRPSLSRQEFYTAMKLVSAAQQNQGVLEDKTASVIVNGLAGPVPPPKMDGMIIPESLTGNGMQGVQESKRGLGQTQTSSAYPLLTNDKAMSYQMAFDHLDLDKDGFVKGSECFGVFMQSGLSKSVLKSIWDVVAGNEGSLNRHQFVQSMYLIDCTKANYPVPKEIPPGQFPPTEKGALDVQTMVNASQNRDIYSTSLEFDMPPKAVYVPTGEITSQYTSILTPVVQHSGLTSSEQAQLERERVLAEQKEAELKRIEDERAAIAARQQFYTEALANLRMTQSKISRGLVEAEQRVEMEKKECTTMEEQYNAAYSEFNEKHAQVGPILKALEEVETEKSALVAKKSALESAIKGLEDYDPDWETKEKGECEALRMEISELVVRQATLEKSTEAMKNRREDMVSIIDGLKKCIEDSTEEANHLVEEVENLDDEMSKNGTRIVDLMKTLAPLYNKLYNSARDALIPLPSEALISTSKSFPVYKYDAAKFGAYNEDWHGFEEEDYSVATVIPADDRLKNFMSPSIRKIEAESPDPPENPTTVEETVAEDPLKDETMEEQAPVPGMENIETEEIISPAEVIENPVFEEGEEENSMEPHDQSVNPTE